MKEQNVISNNVLNKCDSTEHSLSHGLFHKLICTIKPKVAFLHFLIHKMTVLEAANTSIMYVSESMQMNKTVC